MQEDDCLSVQWGAKGCACAREGRGEEKRFTNIVVRRDVISGTGRCCCVFVEAGECRLINFTAFQRMREEGS